MAGSNLPNDIGKDESRIIRHGWVEDLATLYDSIKLTIAPLRYGAGLKGKVGESLCRGIPVVGTTIAFEGYDLGADQDSILADDAEGLAEAVLRVYRDHELWSVLSKRGRKHVLDTPGEQHVANDLTDALCAVFKSDKTKSNTEMHNTPTLSYVVHPAHKNSEKDRSVHKHFEHDYLDSHSDSFKVP